MSVPGQYLSCMAAVSSKQECDTAYCQLQATAECNVFLKDELDDGILHLYMQHSRQQVAVMVPSISSLLLRLLWTTLVHVASAPCIFGRITGIYLAVQNEISQTFQLSASEVELC